MDIFQTDVAASTRGCGTAWDFPSIREAFDKHKRCVTQVKTSTAGHNRSMPISDQARPGATPASGIRRCHNTANPTEAEGVDGVKWSSGHRSFREDNTPQPMRWAALRSGKRLRPVAFWGCGVFGGEAVSARPTAGERRPGGTSPKDGGAGSECAAGLSQAGWPSSTRPRIKSGADHKPTGHLAPRRTAPRHNYPLEGANCSRNAGFASN